MANLIGYGAAQIFPEQDTGTAIREYMKAKAAGKAKRREEQGSYGDEPFEVPDIKRWEDEKNFNEITQMEGTLRDVWNKSYQSGYNIRNPQTPQDAVLSKRYYDSWKKYEEAVDLYTTQGERVNDVIGQIDKMDPEEYDVEATRENLERYIDAPSVFDRAGMVDSIIVRKEEEFDGLEYITEMFPKLTSTSKYITSEDIDPETGKIRKETWEGIPETVRKDAIRTMYNAGDARFKTYVDDLRESNKDATLDNPNWDNAEFAANYFSDIKKGGKENLVFYSTGGGDFNLGIGYGNGKPQKLEDGQYVSNEESVWLYNKNSAGKTEHTSPFQVNLNNDELFGKSTSHVQMPITDEVINAETGKREAVSSQSLFRPNKIVWLPVVSGEQKKGGAGLWDNVTTMLNPNKYTRGAILGDEDLQKLQNAMQENPGTASGYVWRPYVIGTMGYKRKEGEVGGKERILNLNRSVYVPYEDMSDELIGKFGPKWDKAIGDDVTEITKQANFGLTSTQENQEIDFNSLGL